MKKLLLCGLVAAGVLSASGARAAFTFTLTQTGGSVTINGSGTLNTAALTNNSGGIGYNPQIIPSSAFLVAGPASGVATQIYNGGGLNGPANFGTGGYTAEPSGSGSLVGIYGPSVSLFTPTGYVSNSFLTDTATYAGQSFTTLGITPGTYVYTWGTGTNADSLTINAVVPEPSAWTLLGLGLAAVGLVGLRRRRMRA